MSLSDEVARYYAARAAEYDESAGYLDRVAERLREPVKARLRSVFEGHDVLEIACGTGYWTAVIASSARSVLATDVDPGMVTLARERLVSWDNVSLQIADAYSLAGVSGRFTAAYAHWWWSHVPRSRLRGFLERLHGKLVPGALVLFVDQLPYEHGDARFDREGSRVERRRLEDGRCFDVVKNFPTEDEIRAALEGIADDVRYVEHAAERSWNVAYRARAAPRQGTASHHKVHKEHKERCS
jgi:protein-L-isoaspartate O-methyltransferase